MNPSDMFSLAGRVALVTGGYRGIGRMIAQGFLAQGAKVYITGRKAAACDAAAKEMSPDGHCISLPADISKSENIKELARTLMQTEKQLEIGRAHV